MKKRVIHAINTRVVGKVYETWSTHRMLVVHTVTYSRYQEGLYDF